MIGALGLIGGKYRLVRELGRGAFGAVYAARLEPSGEPVALKILARFDQGRSVERFRREVQVLARISPHPNIVRVFESGEHGGLPFVAMELVQGGSLAAALRDGRRPTVAQAAKIAEQVAQGLDHLHRSGVVHRDVNANNVLMDEGGNVRLVDFGLALDQQRVTRITETGELLGTPLTFAPEQLDGKPDAVGFAADIYATSALLYELLTGRSPFQDSKSFRELAHRIRTELPPTADELNPQVPRSLARAVELGLAKRPEDRPRSAAEFARLIKEGFRAAGSRTSTNTSRAQILGEGPRQVGPYEIVLPLGRGRRGIVYSARRVQGEPKGKEAALRVLAVGGELAGAFAQYMRIVEAMKRLVHPHVVASYEAGIEEGFGFVAFEIVRGETLRKLLERDRKLTPAVALEFAAKIARGVAAAHATGIFHGDLRAEDVLIDPEVGPKTGDFMLETVLARSPLEPAEGIARDIQALGGLLHEMLTGRRHTATGVSARLEALDKTGDHLARASAGIALKALDKQAQLRHASAADFAQECERAAGGLSIVSRIIFALRRPSAESSVQRARLALSLVAVLLLVVAGVATRSLVATRRLTQGTVLLDRARAGVRAGQKPELVASDIDQALALIGDDEARLLEAGRLLVQAGDRGGAAKHFRRAVEKAGSLEALYELDGTESKVEQCFEWAGESARKLVERGSEAKARGGRSLHVLELAEARVLVDRAARAEMLRGLAATLKSHEGDAATAVETTATRALLLLEAGELGDAEAEATRGLEAVDADHEHNAERHDLRATELRYLRARARSELGRLLPAERDADEVVALVPGHARALALRASIRARRGNGAGARADLGASGQGVYAKSPPAVLLADQARAAADLGELLLGLEYVGRALAIEKRNPALHLQRAAIHARREAWEECMKSIQEALDLEPTRADLAFLERARSRIKRNGPGDREGARTDLERALAANPRLVPALLAQGGLDARSGDHERALGRFRDAAQIATWSSEPIRLSAEVHRARKNLSAAMATLDQAVALEPERPENRALRALVRLERSEDRDAATQAIEDLDVAFGLDGASASPERPFWLGVRGEAHLRRGEPVPAIDDLTRALEEGREEARFYAARARARQAHHELEAALRDADRAVEIEKRARGPRLEEYEKLRAELQKKK